MYYVYEWYIVETGEIIYVGKGTRNRYKVRKHNKFFNNMINRFNCKSRIVKEFSTEKEAFSYEYEYVKELKEKNQCVCNIYEGGFGGTVECWTDDKRDWYSSHNTMKSQKQRERMSQNNPMKRSEVAEKVNRKKRIPIIIGNKRFDSIKQACEEYNVSSSTINSWIIHGKTSLGDVCRYENKQHIEEYSSKNNGQKKSVVYKGKTYESTIALSRTLDISSSTVSRWCRQGRDSFGNECRYLEDNRIITSTNLKQKNIPIVVNGIWYPSKEHASRALNISSYLLTQYLEKKKRDTKYICEYGNQQPSQGNTNESTLEGSETNR